MGNHPASRRYVMRAGLGLVAGTALAGAASAQAQKVAQNLVQYQTMPKDGNECDKCVNWAPPNACNIVEGTISPKGWCAAFGPKEG